MWSQALFQIVCYSKEKCPVYYYLLECLNLSEYEILNYKYLVLMCDMII